MSKPNLIDLFAEDRGHEEWIPAAPGEGWEEEEQVVRIRVRSARGGRGRVMSELAIYQDTLSKKIGGELPDLLVVAIDTNCASLVEAQTTVDQGLREPFASSADQSDSRSAHRTLVPGRLGDFSSSCRHNAAVRIAEM